MPLFVIDPDNVIRPLDEGTEPNPDETPFSSLKEFVAVSQARNWSKADVTDIWNGFAGEAGPFADLKPQKMFKNRLYGLQAIWKAIQKLIPGAEKRPATPRTGTKRDEVVRLISRANGATQTEIMEKMGWQPHTVRGFMSTLGSKFGIKVESTKTENKGLIYKVA